MFHLPHVSEDAAEPQQRHGSAVADLPGHTDVLEDLFTNMAQCVLDVHCRHVPDGLQEDRQGVLERGHGLTSRLLFLLLVLLADLRSRHVVHSLDRQGTLGDAGHRLHPHLGVVRALAPGRHLRLEREVSPERSKKLLRAALVHAADGAQQAATKGHPHQLACLLEDRRHEAGLVTAQNPAVQALAQLRGAAHLAGQLLALHPLVLL
mmetsp:Transcript_107778/g.300406  ORF Transcript_107778/g.300406 Transcript_107778/m.300406 type:complete len:207 (+) Transcript_107778:228-848(+)